MMTDYPNAKHIPYVGPETWNRITEAQAAAAERQIAAAAAPLPLPVGTPRPARPQQSADRSGEIMPVFSLAKGGDAAAYFQVFSSPLPCPRTLELSNEGAQCGQAPGTMHIGDEVVVVYAAPEPPPIFHPSTRTIVTLDDMGVFREEEVAELGDPEEPMPMPALTITAWGGKGMVTLAVLQNREWARFTFQWNAWNLSVRGEL